MHISYPSSRIRRNKRHSWIRDMLSENQIRKSQLILPVFIKEGSPVEVESMPGVSVLNLDLCLDLISKAFDSGIKAAGLNQSRS